MRNPKPTLFFFSLLIISILPLITPSFHTETSTYIINNNSPESIQSLLENIQFQSKLSHFDAEMKLRQKVINGRTQHEKNILHLYKTHMYNELVNKHPQYNSLPFSNSFLQLKVKRAPNSKENLSTFFADLKNFTYTTNINKLPSRGSSHIEPWSSSWWPILNGQTSVRYNKNAHMNSIGIYDSTAGDFTKRFTYTESISSYIQPNEYYKYKSLSQDEYEKEVNEVWSPSEKYDLLFGDYNFTLTKSEKAHGNKYVPTYGGNIPSWFGYCHGWTPASYLFKRPNKTVSLTAADGKTQVRFLPDDIKGLATAYIANSYYYTNFFGSVCNYRTSKIPTDTETGIYTDTECNDIEPGSTLVLLANMIGILKKNVGFDPDPDFEIWNQPIRGYKVQYFNLNTNKTAQNPNDVKVDISELNIYSSDRFLNYLYKRSPYKTKYVLGIFLTIEYVVETELLHENDKSNPDSIKTSDYMGGINLDIDGNIIGGEWRYNHHPDFIWKISELVPPSSSQDKYVPTFTGSNFEIANILPYVKKQSQLKVPMKAVIEFLANESYIQPSNPNEVITQTLISDDNYISIGNGNPLINWGNGVFTVKSENNTIIFTGTALITRTEPTASYYRYIDPANGVAYYSFNPFVYRIKTYEERDDVIKPENDNNGNDPQIGAKKLVYCEDNIRYTLEGSAIVSLQCPAKGNYFTFVTKKGKVFYSLKTFMVKYGEVEECNAEDYATYERYVIEGGDNGIGNEGEGKKEVKINVDGREYVLKGDKVITKEKPKRGSYFMFTLPNGETYYSEKEFSVTYTYVRGTRGDDRNNNRENERERERQRERERDRERPRGSDRERERRNDNDNSKELNIKVGNRKYTLKGNEPISKTQPNGSYFKFTLPNNETYYSKSPFTVTYTIDNTPQTSNHPNSNNNNNYNFNHNNYNTYNDYNNYNTNNNYNNYNTNNNPLSSYLSSYLTSLNNIYGLSSSNIVTRVFGNHIYTITGQSAITLQQPAGRFYYYDMPDGTRYYSSTPFNVSIT